jgi:selenocysteine-specific elongation factor
LPGDRRARVRSVQVHGGDVPAAHHGQRVALNLVGVERMTVARGHVVASEALERTTTASTRSSRRRRRRAGLASHSGARPRRDGGSVGKVVVLEERGVIPRRARAGRRSSSTSPCWRSRRPVRPARRDRARTLGGGVVVNPFADRHRRDEPHSSSG